MAALSLSFWSQVLMAITAQAAFPGIPLNDKPPIILDRSGGFQIGGRVQPAPFGRNMTLSCDHGYMEYFIPRRPRETAIVMWHSSSTQTFQNRWDGGEGYKDKFLRRRYPVYLWDGPRVGRANWACQPTFYQPDYRDQGNFAAWNFGPSYPNWWPGVQFPTKNTEAWQQATSARYVEYDATFNVELETDAAAVAADSGKLGNSIVYLGNSASGLRAQLTATKSNTTNIKGIVAYEAYGCVFPETANLTNITTSFPGAQFGPMKVPLERFKKLTKLKKIQFIFGDHRDESFEFLKQARLATKYINQYGGHAEVLKLPDAGLKGNTHIAFADMNNDEVADLLDDYLGNNDLDWDYEEEGGENDDEEEDEEDNEEEEDRDKKLRYER